MSKTKKNIKQEALSKEKDVHELAEKLEKAGYEVRREKLKQGAGWKTVSGVCSVEGRAIVFVDRKNPIEDQILFLKSLVEKLTAASLPVQA